MTQSLRTYFFFSQTEDSLVSSAQYSHTSNSNQVIWNLLDSVSIGTHTYTPLHTILKNL